MADADHSEVNDLQIISEAMLRHDWRTQQRMLMWLRDFLISEEDKRQKAERDQAHDAG